MEHEFIKLEHIDTSVAAKNFAKLLYDNKTYFLNGSWGSGKSEFLDEVKKNSPKKLITIDFWRLTDTRTTIEIAFSKLYPFLYWAIRVGVVFLVAVSILMTNVVDIGLSNYFGGSKPLILKLGGVVALIVAVWQVFKKKSDEFYCFLLSKLPKFSKVLIIDDFDRMSEKQQEESYKLFSLINGKLPIVFVGDITKVHKNDDNYLSKIIDRQVELPFDLHPSNIWDNYFSVLEDKFNIGLSNDFKKRVSSDQKNLRDREHFNDYVNQEFFRRGKFGRVQVEQQLLVIYAYLFYPELYNNIIEGVSITIKDSEETVFQSVTKKGLTIKEQLSKIQRFEILGYPFCFNRNPQGYQVYEVSSNRTEDELDILFDNMSEDLVKELVESDKLTDFYQYLNTQYQTFSENQQNQLFEIAIKESLKLKNSPSMNFIIQERFSELYYSVNGEETDLMDLDGEEFNAKRIERIEAIFEPLGYDQSQIIYILEKHNVLSFPELGKSYTNLIITPETILKYKRKDFILLTYLHCENLSRQFINWDRNIWECIDLFDNREFLSFWRFQSIITNKLDIKEFDIIPVDKNYIIWIGRYLSKFPDDYIDYRESVISKIKPRIEKMKKEGFIFTEKIDERHKR
ncbi:P-loop NTPase fold protein [Streptococcus salivarius]|uniref:P-loop NTPase fold protein n=2 Tax=Streptococcus salivarius TaxID=1304 RepID=UPI000939B64D|nr:P-loop NTPase fold protein [Streptococcus salivarius]